MADIDLSGVGKTFAGTPALQDITTRFDDGEFIALLGPSGCGKTTLLRILAGFEAPSYGRLRIGTREMANARTGASLPPKCAKSGLCSNPMRFGRICLCGAIYPTRLRSENYPRQKSQIRPMPPWPQPGWWTMPIVCLLTFRGAKAAGRLGPLPCV
nr:ATP-binding cassette domain-containing protein [Phaeobacter inhibens]